MPAGEETVGPPTGILFQGCSCFTAQLPSDKGAIFVVVVVVVVVVVFSGCLTK